MADGFYGGYCACSYWGEAGLRWWGSDLQVVGGIDGDFGGWVKTRLMGEDVGHFFFFSLRLFVVVVDLAGGWWRRWWVDVVIVIWMGGYGGQRCWVEKERDRGKRDRERKNKK